MSVEDTVLLQLQQVLRRLRAQFRSVHQGLPLRSAELWFLTVLAHRGAQSASAMAEAAGVSRAAASLVIRRLLDLGLIAQSVDEGDRRRRVIVLAEAGTELLNRVQVLRQSQMSAMLNRLSIPEQHQLITLLKKLLDQAI